MIEALGGMEASGSRLAVFRRLAGLSQEELADRSGLTNRAIGNPERGRTKRPHPDSALRLADALDLNGEARRLFIAAADRRRSAAPAASEAPMPKAQMAVCSWHDSGAQVVPRQLPPSVGQFTGRALEMAALTGLLDPADHAAGTIVRTFLPRQGPSASMGTFAWFPAGSRPDRRSPR